MTLILIYSFYFVYVPSSFTQIMCTYFPYPAFLFITAFFYFNATEGGRMLRSLFNIEHPPKQPASDRKE
ncbi:uncharacterized protein VTP21DRAFT_2955 [Calcarisporiella thermophila]|uniref:uncharacterized protein n=1 Tax=Calcarisporiella thermophila TaxID=911321 RepID=UPI00374205A3